MCYLCPLNDMTAAANACKNVNPHFAYPARSVPTRLKLLRPRGGKLQHAHCTFISPPARCNERLSASPACPSLLRSSAPASAPPPPPLLWGAGAKPPSTRLRLALESAEEFMLQEGGAGCTRLKATAAAAAAAAAAAGGKVILKSSVTNTSDRYTARSRFLSLERIYKFPVRPLTCARAGKRMSRICGGTRQP